MKNYINLLALAAVLLLSHVCFGQQQNPINIRQKVKIDSLLDTYSIEEILQFRAFYQRKIADAEKEKNTIREKGIEDAKKFIADNPKSKILDKVLMRLAELYYEKANDLYVKQLQEYDDQVSVYDSLGIDKKIEEPKLDYSGSLSIYERIIRDFPFSNLVDDAYYNKGYILEEVGELDSALQVYHTIVEKFPDSRYAPESLMRIAEYHFNPPRNEIDTAIVYYKKILTYEDSPKYNQALYRLGWCYYRLSDFPQSVSYFTLLIEDVERTKKLGVNSQISNPDLRDEAVEYIGLSFLDSGENGLSGAVAYIDSMGKPAFGIGILQKMGDVYMNDKEEYPKAIAAYSKLLKLYPQAEIAPHIHENIVDCYRLLGDNRLTYLSRDQLFNLYKPGSSWWARQKNEKAKERAYQATERALRDNISLLFTQAEEAGDEGLYLAAVNDCRKYLKNFPTDSNSARIHWNMALTLDTKLKQSDEAFEEYMKICDLYWDSNYQRYAAENAIALGRDAVELDTTRKEIQFDGRDQLNVKEIKGNVLAEFHYNRIQLTPSEKKLIRAYNNYIKLYPHEKETVKILNNAGALFFNNNMFAEALKYFNTIVKHFPNNEKIYDIKYQILESYFGKGDYRSAEIVARKIKNDGSAPPALVEKAKRRLAESIFLSAKVFAAADDHLQAGNEFLRMAQEVPDAPFVDLSLFNAAVEYDKAREYGRAVETYNFLVETREDSKYLLDAMNNLAIDYGEIHEFKNAALTYERLARVAKDSLQIHDALFNSSLFFVKATDWENAIRINSEFVDKFPNSEDADDLFFDIANYYLKLDKFAEANKIYGEYVEKFPTSPRVVESFYRRGRYYEDKKEIDNALAEYGKAVDKNAEFQKAKLEPNDYFAAEALSRATKIKFNEFRKIEFELPQANMEKSRLKKRDLLIEIVDGFTKTASYGTVHLYESTYDIGKAYEEFADTWVRQEIPPMSVTQLAVTKKQINEAAVELYQRAEKSYKQSIKILRRLADKYEKSLLTSDTSQVKSDISKKYVQNDSTLYIARRWIDRCEEQLSKVVYDMAELHLATIQDLLHAPIPQSLSQVERMEYNRQVLERAVEPLVRAAVEEHIRNIQEAWDLGIENRWVKSSRLKAIQTNNLMADEYRKLAFMALDLHGRNIPVVKKLASEGGTTQNGFDLIGLSDQQAGLLDFSKEFMLRAVDYYRQTLDIVNEIKIHDPSALLTEENILKQVYLFALRSDSLAKIDYSNKKFYEKLSREKKESKFEDALFTFEDNYFSLKENAVNVLKTTRKLAVKLGIKNRWLPRVELALVSLRPDEFKDLLGLAVDSRVEYSDSSWLAFPSYVDDWLDPDFSEQEWQASEIVSGEENKAHNIWLTKLDTVGFSFDTTEAPYGDSLTFALAGDSSVLNLSFPDSLFSDSTFYQNKIKIDVKKTPKLKRVSCERVYFRKHFSIVGLPVAVEIEMKVDDSFNLFVNGEYIAGVIRQDSSAFSQGHYILSDGLKSGDNVLAVEGIDSDRTAQGMTATMAIKSLPDWDKKRQRILFETSNKKIKENLSMDKYIILY
ncbi:MAG: tetratricopeptide repeat protein [Calditrichaeota bacterium]|nr:tetratricopeptide repeat protein [Calditrichota bacterium]